MTQAIQGAISVSTLPARRPTPLRTELLPADGWQALGLRELWQYRELLFTLAQRDIKVRYKQTILGAAWAVIQPVTQMVVFTILFGRVAHVSTYGIAYPVFSFAALLPMTLFTASLANASGSLMGAQQLISKIYFPRLAIPLSSVLSCLVDFGISFLILIVLMLFYRVPVGPEVLALPFFIMLALAAATGVGLWLAALTAKYRDFRHTVPFITQIWFFASPVVYSASIVPPQYRLLYSLNPMVGVIKGFRWCLLTHAPRTGVDAQLLLNTPFNQPEFYASIAAVVLILISGMYYFRRVENTFADLI
jgi:lipopolysaccharide transport system permease protein